MDLDTALKLINESSTQEDVFQVLRSLPLDIVGCILLDVPRERTGSLRHLPAMAPDDVQINWTGSSGHHLLAQSCAFVRAMENNYYRINNRTLENIRVLDYGCGWGRLIRLMYKYTDASNIYGCDPWDKSIELCRESNLLGSFALSEYLPSQIPFGETKFELIYAFSVFTHLSERAAKAALAACREALADNGMMVITIRPTSYWEHHLQSSNPTDISKMLTDHAEKGFAFSPHNRQPIDGDITYGDTSISLKYIEEHWSDWEVVGTDWLMHDPYQTILFLQPR